MAVRNWNSLWLLPPAIISSVCYGTDYLTVDQAQKQLFPAADLFVKRQTDLSDEQKKQIEQLANTRQRNRQPPIWRAQAKGKLLGWFLVDEVVGKHVYITYAAALGPDGKVLGVEILTYRETHGGQIVDPNWRKKFVGKTLSDPFKLDVDVANISGATLSCRNVLDGVKRLLALHKVMLSHE